MNIWFKLSPDQASDFQVPHHVASAPSRDFYSTLPLSNLYHGGPWLLLSFQHVQERPFLVTFQPCTVELSFINEFESFNPLSNTQSGHLRLDKNEIQGLIELLVNYADQMPNGHVPPHHTFEEIAPEHWHNFHIYNTQAQTGRQRVFLQITDPTSDMHDDSIVSIMIVSENNTRQNFNHSGPSIQIAFRQFSIEQLSDPLFSPMDQAVSQIVLDKYGLVELAMLLEKVFEDKQYYPSIAKKNLGLPIPTPFPLNNNQISLLV